MDLVVKSRSGLTNSRHVQGTSWDPPFLPQEGQLLGLGGKGVWESGLGPRGLCEVVSSPCLGLMNSHKIGESQVGGGEVREGGLPSPPWELLTIWQV